MPPAILAALCPRRDRELDRLAEVLERLWRVGLLVPDEPKAEGLPVKTFTGATPSRESRPKQGRPR